MPQNFGIFRALQCLAPYETPQCSKNPNVLRHEVHQTLQCLENPKNSNFFVNYAALRAIDREKIGIFWIFQALQCLGTSCPKTFGFFEHYSVWCTSELYIILLLYDSIALLPYYFFTLLFITLLLKYFVTLFINYSFLQYWYDFITLVVYLCIAIVLHCY